MDIGIITHKSNTSNLSEGAVSGVTVSEVHERFYAAREAQVRVRELVEHGDQCAVEAIFEVAHAFYLAADKLGPVTELSNDLAAIINGDL